MFYSQKDIEDTLTCPVCKIRFNVPKILQCGGNICLSCELTLFNNQANTEFECPLCQKQHEIPPNGLIINTFIQRFLQVQPKEIYRGKAHKECKESLNQFATNLADFSYKYENLEEIVKSHYEHLRYEIDILTESYMKALNEYRDQMLTSIDKYEETHLHDVKKCKKELEHIPEFIEQCKTICQEKVYL